jgi:hypothetical protein
VADGYVFAAAFAHGQLSYRGRRAHHQQQSIARRDGILDLLGKGELTRGHRNAVEPHLEPSGGQAVVEAPDEIFIVRAAVGEKQPDRCRMAGLAA